ncbi:MAG: hypothetical protein IPJ79_18140 [Bacteroidetes bacterium]|nr:hypothetical protein [Bacteroidota bacterium]
MGTYSATADLDPGAAAFNVTSTAFWNIFVVKLNSAGNFVWGKKISGTDNIHCYNGVETDAAGNVVIGGFFTGTIDFDPGAGTFNMSNAGGVTPDIFILKLTAAGNFSWAVRIGSTQPDYCRDITVDAAGNVCSR